MMIASTNAEVCEVNEHGSYGIYTFYNNVDKIHFYYQLEYDTDIDNDTDLHNMQDALEREISNDILQTTSLFPQCAASSGRNLEVLGANPLTLLSRPRDRFSDKVCTSKSVRNSICKIVKGDITLMYEDDADSTTSLKKLEKDINNAIENGMDGDLKYAHSGVLAVNFLSEDEFRALPFTAASSGSFGMMLTLAVSVMAVGLVGGLGYKYRGRLGSRSGRDSMDWSTGSPVV
jgi:hypothetical protein